MITRRQTAKLLTAGALFPSALFAASPVEQPTKFPEAADFLRNALNNRLVKDCKGTFSVIDLEYEKIGATHKMFAVIRLEWPPGTRRRPILSEGPSDQEAFQTLFENTLDTFRPAWPSCIL